MKCSRVKSVHICLTAPANNLACLNYTFELDWIRYRVKNYFFLLVPVENCLNRFALPADRWHRLLTHALSR